MGNPGAEYAITRHNAGFLLADHLAERWRLSAFRRHGPARVAIGSVGDMPVAVLKPWTYMNRSGGALAPLLADEEFDPARDLLILVDEAALPLGAFRLRARGSAGGHNGLRSIEASLQSREYARLRIGVGPKPEGLDGLTDHVLGPFAAEELDALAPRWPTMGDAAECWVTDGIEEAMKRFNQLGKTRD